MTENVPRTDRDRDGSDGAVHEKSAKRSGRKVVICTDSEDDLAEEVNGDGELLRCTAKNDPGRDSDALTRGWRKAREELPRGSTLDRSAREAEGEESGGRGEQEREHEQEQE